MAEDTSKKEGSSFPSMEEEVIDFWDKSATFQLSLKKEAPKGDYVFYDGPPFATGTPHYGHLVGNIMKDVVPRYQTMRGYHVERKWGWDCHGLPIENIVEKELGLKTKKDIEDMGVGKFNDLCRERVLGYVDDWRRIIRRLGRWADMDNAYKTMDLDFMDSIWWSFKQLWDHGFIYQNYRSMHICPRCETTLSQSEVSEGYKDIKDLSCTAEFELVDEPGVFILAWTTTPWTLIGNVALAVGSDIEYVKVSSAGKYFILAKERLADNFKDQAFEILESFKGSTLVGKSYRPLFDYYQNDESLENKERGWRVYAADFVTTTDGTGVVHIAPAFGEDDMELGRLEKLPFIQHVGLDGVFKPEVKDFSGLHVKPIGDHSSTDVEIIKFLAHQERLFSKEKYEHSYPHCWRCDTPLINYATSSWFVKVTEMKPRLLENAKLINWSPSHIKEGRFGNWLEGARDWSISRQRFWASAIPIWECDCGEKRVIGSVAELEGLTGQKINDIHKDKIDDLSFACEKCGGQMHRIPDVLDCWFESGSMPFAQLHYPTENKELFENNFPAQFIGEGVDQTRCWFYYLHVIAGGIFDRPAYQNVMVNGTVLAEDGKKMSKKLKNYPDPGAVMEKYGSDALRAYLASSPVMQAENFNFSEKGVQEALRKNVMLLWNTYRFYEMYADGKIDKRSSQNILDLWIKAKQKNLIIEVTAAMEAYNMPKAARAISEFIDELSTWYLRRSRDRFKSENLEDKANALATMHEVLLSLAKVMAPIMPFISERLWQSLEGYNFKDSQKSVHLESWPEPADLDDNDKSVLEKMSLVRRVVEMGLARRDEAGIKIRQMLGEIKISGGATAMIDNDDYLSLIKDELNVRSASIVATEQELSIELDTTITPELKKEGLKRELVRSINMIRKDKGLEISDRSRVIISGASSELAEVIGAMQADICRETLSSSLDLSEANDGQEIKVNDEKIFINLEIIN
jgi:isoleucyl-tRNA synthetase